MLFSYFKSNELMATLIYSAGMLHIIAELHDSDEISLEDQ